VRVLEVSGADPNQYAEAHFGLAVIDSARGETTGDTRRRASTALRLMQGAGPRHAPRRREMQAWLREHGIDPLPDDAGVTGGDAP
jgi:hypothetical protein